MKTDHDDRANAADHSTAFGVVSIQPTRRSMLRLSSDHPTSKSAQSVDLSSNCITLLEDQISALLRDLETMRTYEFEKRSRAPRALRWRKTDRQLFYPYLSVKGDLFNEEDIDALRRWKTDGIVKCVGRKDGPRFVDNKPLRLRIEAILEAYNGWQASNVHLRERLGVDKLFRETPSIEAIQIKIARKLHEFRATTVDGLTLKALALYDMKGCSCDYEIHHEYIAMETTLDEDERNIFLSIWRDLVTLGKRADPTRTTDRKYQSRRRAATMMAA